MALGAAAKSATSELVSNGISVTVNTTGSQPCEAPDDLLSAEAEGLLRRSGAVVRPTVLAGAEVTIRVVSLPDGLRCVSSVYMALTIDRLQNVGSDPYFGDIVVDDALVALAHPQSDHRQVLRRVVNERLTVWANELARHREP